MRHCALAAMLAIVACAASADPVTVSSKNRTKLFASQTALLDSRAAVQYSGSVRLQPSPVVIPGQGGTARYSGRYARPVPGHGARGRAASCGARGPVPAAGRSTESGWNPRARSHKGAIGLAQLMPGTAQRLAVDPHDPRQNLEGGARYLRRQYERFRQLAPRPRRLQCRPRSGDTLRRHSTLPRDASLRAAYLGRLGRPLRLHLQAVGQRLDVVARHLRDDPVGGVDEAEDREAQKADADRDDQRLPIGLLRQPARRPCRRRPPPADWRGSRHRAAAVRRCRPPRPGPSRPPSASSSSAG